jgi:hypothetical protein
MSAGNAQRELYVADWQLDFVCGDRSSALSSDPNIDDPVNDTGRGPRLGDMELSEEFACLLSALVGDGEEF